MKLSKNDTLYISVVEYSYILMSGEFGQVLPIS